LKNYRDADAYSGAWDSLGIYLSDGKYYEACNYSRLYGGYAKTRIQDAIGFVLNPPKFERHTGLTQEEQERRAQNALYTQRIQEANTQLYNCLRNGITAFVKQYTGMDINGKTYKFQVGKIAEASNHAYGEGYEVRIQYQSIGRLWNGRLMFLADVRLLNNKKANMDIKEYHLAIRTQHDFDTRQGFSDAYRGIQIDKEYISSLDKWPSTIVIQLANVLSGVKPSETMRKESDTPIAEDSRSDNFPVVKEFKTTNEEVKAWNALHKLVTLMESKIK
jgi:hypothetical protein